MGLRWGAYGKARIANGRWYWLAHEDEHGYHVTGSRADVKIFDTIEEVEAVGIRPGDTVKFDTRDRVAYDSVTRQPRNSAWTTSTVLAFEARFIRRYE